jgi:hypothetical protein
MGRQGKTGAKGPRGLQGARGATGGTGRRGKVGKPGEKGLKGVSGPAHKNEVMERVGTYFDDVYQQLNEQAKWIAKMQRELDVMIAAVGKGRA